MDKARSPVSKSKVKSKLVHYATKAFRQGCEHALLWPSSPLCDCYLLGPLTFAARRHHASTLINNSDEETEAGEGIEK